MERRRVLPSSENFRHMLQRVRRLDRMQIEQCETSRRLDGEIHLSVDVYIYTCGCLRRCAYAYTHVYVSREID